MIVSTTMTVVATAVDITPPVRDRDWWRAEAARVGSDWNGIIAGHVAVVAHLAGWSACDICGAQPCVNTSFCNTCRVADRRRGRKTR